MTAVATPDAARLVFAAVAGLILLLILIIKFKVHAMISILIGAVGIGLMAGLLLIVTGIILDVMAKNDRKAFIVDANRFALMKRQGK